MSSLFAAGEPDENSVDPDLRKNARAMPCAAACAHGSPFRTLREASHLNASDIIEPVSVSTAPSAAHRALPTGRWYHEDWPLPMSFGTASSSFFWMSVSCLSSLLVTSFAMVCIPVRKDRFGFLDWEGRFPGGGLPVGS